MATFVLAFLTIAVSLLGLGVGVLVGRRPLARSCSGLACGGCSKAGGGPCRRDDEEGR